MCFADWPPEVVSSGLGASDGHDECTQQDGSRLVATSGLHRKAVLASRGQFAVGHILFSAQPDGVLSSKAAKWLCALLLVAIDVQVLLVDGLKN